MRAIPTTLTQRRGRWALLALGVALAAGLAAQPAEGQGRDPGPGRCYVAPNPVHGGPCRLLYHMRSPGRCRLHLYQASGDAAGWVEVSHASAGLHSCDISTERYAPGVYLCWASLLYDSGEEEVLPLQKLFVLKGL